MVTYDYNGNINQNKIDEFLNRIMNGEDTTSDDIEIPTETNKCGIFKSLKDSIKNIKEYDEALTIISKEPVTSKSLKKELSDIYYIVSLKERYKYDLYLTTITKEFCGKIVNQTADNIYFELNGSNALVIIPHNWIEWLAPSKKLWNRDKGENYV